MSAPHDKDTKDAWAEYRLVTRNLIGEVYERAEPFAWAQLQSKLGKLKPARSRRQVTTNAT